MRGTIAYSDTMVTQAKKIFISAGDFEIDISGATVEVDARLIQIINMTIRGQLSCNA